MTSLRGRQDPTYVVCPSCDTSDGPNCVELMRRCGLDLLTWQSRLLTGIMGRSPDGLWVAPTAAASLARQNGKTDGIEVPRICHGMAVNGEWVLYTAQLQKTATETFERVRDIFETRVLKPMVKTIHTAVGRESIDLKNGARIKFLARTRNGGRGQHADLLVFDEAQELTDSQLESFVPVISASRNPQTLYLGTPPTPDSPGTVFRRVREEARNGAPLTYWAEWSVPEIPTNPSDEQLWAETNPSLGVLILPRTIAKEAVELSPDGFARERLGWWSPERAPVPPAINPDGWRACEIDFAPEPSSSEIVACGIKFSGDGSTYSVSMAVKSNDGPILVECVDRAGTARGVSGLAHWLYERKGRLSTVCVDGREWTPTLIQRLEDMGYPKKGLHVMRTREVADACAMLANAVEGKTVAHIAQPLLAESVASSPRRQVGSDGWAFGGSDPTPIESVALAHWGAMTTKRNPKRKLRVSV